MATQLRYQLKTKIRDAYLELVCKFPLTSIRSDAHLRAAQEVIDRLLPRMDNEESVQLYVEALSDLVAAYEDEHHPLPAPSDADLLRHLMDARGITQADLYRETGLAKSTISEVLAGKRPFSRQMIRKLADYFSVDVGLLAVNLGR